MICPLKRLLPTIALLFSLAAASALAEPLAVVTSFSILGDMARQIGGERVAVHSLVGPGADAHVYQPTPSDVKTLATAKLVVVNGLGFEGWIDRLIQSSGYHGQTVVASAGIKPLEARGKDDEHHEGPHHDEGHHHDSGIDPHAWQDPRNALRYADNIANGLAEADPAGKEIYLANARRFQQEVAAAAEEIRKTFAAIPTERRKVVTSHEAFNYFGHAYGIEFIAPVGVNTEAEASAADVGRIIRQIQREKIPAVFMENISNPRLLQRIRQESKARIGGTLYSDSLSKSGGPAASYLDMLKHNTRTLTAALTGK